MHNSDVSTIVKEFSNISELAKDIKLDIEILDLRLKLLKKQLSKIESSVLRVIKSH